ncbi:MAG: DnaB-like helicase N-terminal domain-containing protein [Cyanobacteria bacterium P01_E01_bin.35]
MDRDLPPCSLEAEEALLGCILLKPELIVPLMKTLPVEAFFLGAHQSIYQGMIYTQKKGFKPDLLNLTDYLKGQNVLETVGGMARISRFLNQTVSVTNYDRYAKLILDKFQRRRLISLSGQIADLGYNETLKLLDIYEEIRSLLPDEITAASQVTKPIKIKTVRYSQYSQDKSNKIELEGEITDGSSVFKATAELAAEVKYTAEKLWKDITE